MVVHSWGTFVYAPPETRQGDLIMLPEDEVHHLSHVLRKKSGQQIYATDGEGSVYRCVSLDSHRLQIEETIPGLGEPLVHITLAVGILKGDGNRDIVDQATQLGVRRVIFIEASRSEGRLLDNKLERLQKIAVSAIKQCGRARLPEIVVAESVKASLKFRDDSTILLLAQQSEAESEKTVLETDPPSNSKLMIFVGPEGGFDAEEIEMLRISKAGIVHLGGRRLRTAVAVNAALCYCLHLSGEIKRY